MAANGNVRLHTPLGLLAELTHRCPLGCPYCSNPLALERPGAELVQFRERTYVRARELYLKHRATLSTAPKPKKGS